MPKLKLEVIVDDVIYTFINEKDKARFLKAVESAWHVQDYINVYEDIKRRENEKTK